MWKCVALLVTVYIICVDAVPLYGSEENSTIYSNQNGENISTPDKNHDAENPRTIRTNQSSANITGHATKNDVSTTAKDVLDFLAFWGNNLTNLLKKVSSFNEHDKNAVIFKGPISSDSEEHVNNETNHQQESRYFNDKEMYTMLNPLGSDETNNNSETDNKSKECHDSNNSEGCSNTNHSEDSEHSENSDESEDSDDTEYSDYGDYGNYDDVSDETVDPYASDEADKRNEIDNELYDVYYKGNVGSNGPNTKKYTGNDAKTNFDDYVRSESEAYHLYGDNVDEEGDKCEDILSVNDVFGGFPSIDDGETNMKLNMENSGHILSIASASYYINLIYLILIIHFHIEYLT